MTAQELLRVAKNINPNKFDEDPEAAIQDAYIVWEAVRIAKLEKVSAPGHLEFPEPGNSEEPPITQWHKRRQRTKPKTTVDHLKTFLQFSGKSTREVAERFEVSTGAVSGWVTGKFKPSANNTAKIEAFLTDVGYYE